MHWRTTTWRMRIANSARSTKRSRATSWPIAIGRSIRKRCGISAFAILLLGNFREGWPLFECRQEAEEVMLDRFHASRAGMARRSTAERSSFMPSKELATKFCLPRAFPTSSRGQKWAVRFGLRSAIGAIVCPLVSRRRRFIRMLRRTDWSPPALPERIDVQIPAGSLPLHFAAVARAFPRRKRFLVVEPTAGSDVARSIGGARAAK